MSFSFSIEGYFHWIKNLVFSLLLSLLLSLLHFKHIIPLSSTFFFFWWEISYHLYHCFSVYNVLLFSDAFRIFFLSLGFSILTKMYIGITFFLFILLGVHWDVLYQIGVFFSHYFFKSFFFPLLFFLSLWDYNYKYVITIIPYFLTSLRSSSYIFQFFPLFLNWIILLIYLHTYQLFCHVQSIVKLIQWVF